MNETKIDVCNIKWIKVEYMKRIYTINYELEDCIYPNECQEVFEKDTLPAYAKRFMRNSVRYELPGNNTIIYY